MSGKHDGEKELVLLIEDIPEHGLKAGIMGLADSLEEDKIDVLFFKILRDKVEKKVKCENLDKKKIIRMDEFYDKERLRSKSIFLKIALLLYAPIGILLVILRLSMLCIAAILVQFFTSLKHNRRLSLFLSIFVCGYWRIYKNRKEFYKSDARTVVSNHISLVDHVCYLSLDIFMFARKLSEQDILYKAFNQIMAGDILEIEQNDTVEVLKEKVLEKLKKYPSKKMVVFPEGEIHTGKYLHDFRSFTFSLGDSVLPVVLKIFSVFPICYHPFIYHLKTYRVRNMLWTIFLPFNIFYCKILPTVYRKENESHKEFADRVQNIIASELGIIPTSFTMHDKNLYKKDRAFYRKFLEDY